MEVAGNLSDWRSCDYANGCQGRRRECAARTVNTQASPGGCIATRYACGTCFTFSRVLSRRKDGVVDLRFYFPLLYTFLLALTSVFGIAFAAQRTGHYLVEHSSTGGSMNGQGRAEVATERPGDPRNAWSYYEIVLDLGSPMKA